MNQKGFTLIETILYIALVTFILVTISMFLIHILNAQVKTRAISQVLASATLVQDRLSEAVRHADGINVGASTFGVDPGVLSLDMVDGARSPTVFSLSADDGQLMISEAGGAATALTSDDVKIKTLLFENLTTADDVGIIQVQFTIEVYSTAGSKPYFYDQGFQTTLRIPLD